VPTALGRSREHDGGARRRRQGAEAQDAPERPDVFDVLLDDDVERPPAGAVDVIRRGLRVSPELRQGLGVTIGLALVGAFGRVLIPVLTQQVIDRGLGGGDAGQRPHRRHVDIALAAAVLVVTTAAWAAARAMSTCRRCGRWPASPPPSSSSPPSRTG
jgi:hypothetical protein